MTAAQAVALILFGLAGVLTAISWLSPIDLRVPVLLAALAGVILVLGDAGTFS